MRFIPGVVLALIFGSFSPLYAQVFISGKLTDQKGKPLPGAAIQIKGSYDGTTSDSVGKFRFETTETGAQVLEVSMTGYGKIEEPVSIGLVSLEKNISLKEVISELEAVSITAGSFEASDKKKGTVLTSLDIVTTAGANADVTGALKTLPGAQQVGESEGLFVRGGSATESKIFMDGTLVNNFFYSSLPGIATRGRFNPFLFKGTVFSTGGYSALYGQALSAALILESTDLPERSEADLGVSVIGINGGIQKLAKNKKSSWGLTYGYTNLILAFKVIKQGPDFFKVPEYHQADGNFRIKTKKGGFIKYYGYAAGNRTGVRQRDIDSLSLLNAFDLRNLNTFQNISWRENLGNGWKMFTAASFSTNRDRIENELQNENGDKQTFQSPFGYYFKNFSLLNKAYYGQGRFVFDKRIGAGINVLRFGADHFYSNEKTEYRSVAGQVFPESVKERLTAAFAETDVYITNDLAFKGGTRFEYSKQLDKLNIAPRVSVAYKFPNKGQASFAYGIFYQNPERRYLPSLSGGAGGVDFSKATHYILQYQKSTSERTFRTEAFYKKYDDLFRTGTNMIGREVVVNNDGYGYAKGVEVFWRDKKTIKDFDYWISYSFLDTKRNYLNYPQEITPSFAAVHTASLVTKKFVTKWKTGFNASYNFATGRPYYKFAYSNMLNKLVIAEEGRTIPYNSLGFSLNYLPNLGKQNAKAFSVFVLSVTNVLGQKQVFGYNFSSINNNRTEVVPPSRRFVFIGCFLSFGTDRTQQAINNNL